LFELTGKQGGVGVKEDIIILFGNGNEMFISLTTSTSVVPNRTTGIKNTTSPLVMNWQLAKATIILISKD